MLHKIRSRPSCCTTQQHSRAPFRISKLSYRIRKSRALKCPAYKYPWSSILAGVSGGGDEPPASAFSDGDSGVKKSQLDRSYTVSSNFGSIFRKRMNGLRVVHAPETPLFCTRSTEGAHLLHRRRLHLIHRPTRVFIHNDTSASETPCICIRSTDAALWFYGLMRLWRI